MGRNGGVSRQWAFITSIWWVGYRTVLAVSAAATTARPQANRRQWVNTFIFLTDTSHLSFYIISNIWDLKKITLFSLTARKMPTSCLYSKLNTFYEVCSFLPSYWITGVLELFVLEPNSHKIDIQPSL